VKKMFPQLLAVVLMAAVTGCGFQLRGTIDLPPEWRSLQLISSSPNGELNRAMESALERAGVEYRDPVSAGYHLYMGEEVYERRNLTIGSNARASEFELIMSTTLRVTDSEGTEITPEIEVSTHKVITADPENITGKVEETRLLRREMRQDLVQQLMRQLRFLATTPAPTAETSTGTTPTT
jgi:LPS-assembly lipoprotein